MGPDRIDERLEESGQQVVRALVRDLPEEPVSLAWRSELNEKLNKAAASRRRVRRFWNITAPSLALSAACALAFMMLGRTGSQAPGIGQPTGPVVSRPAPDLASELVNAHQEAVFVSDVAGSGLAPTEVSESSAQHGNISDSDLELL
jgi:hypothetical protein